jgi:hypothetical protein
MRIKHQQTRDSSMYSHFVDLISGLLMALLLLALLAKHKLLLLNKGRLQAVLRVDAMDGGFDEAKETSHLNEDGPEAGSLWVLLHVFWR